jgi:hypothetical protein
MLTGDVPCQVDSSQGLALSRAKESLRYLIVLPSVLPPGGRIKDFSHSIAFRSRSYWDPGSFETSSSMIEPSNALPRLRTL